MSGKSFDGRPSLWLCLWGLLLCCPPPLPAQSALSLGQSYEAASTGYFRDQDSLPGAFRLYQQSPEGKGNFWGLGPGGGAVKRASFAADAHAGVAGYGVRTCASCHEEQRYSLHSSRADVACVQCHRGQPVAGIHHYYSAMNPIRRHAYVCAKCHEGASASFAAYVIHEPPPLARETKQEFPLFYYATWFMVILAGGVFIVFIPYVTLWGLRELLGLFSRQKSHG